MPNSNSSIVNNNPIVNKPFNNNITITPQQKRDDHNTNKHGTRDNNNNNNSRFNNNANNSNVNANKRNRSPSPVVNQQQCYFKHC
jgi:hypothetical protein